VAITAVLLATGIAPKLFGTAFVPTILIIGELAVSQTLSIVASNSTPNALSFVKLGDSRMARNGGVTVSTRARRQSPPRTTASSHRRSSWRYRIARMALKRI